MCATDETYFLSNKQRIQLNNNLNIDGLVEAAINQLFNDNKIDDATRKQLIQSHYEPLKQAVNEGFGSSPVGEIKGAVEYGTPNYEFLKQLQTNTAVFAAFKNHSSIKEMAALLKDKDGNVRTREEFKKQALQVDATYRGRYLDVEYNSAVRTARAAEQWQKIQATKHLYPNIKYMSSVAAHPRADHTKYYGIVRPVDDPFWNHHTPPNGWECKCRIESSRDDTTDIPNNLPPVPKEFAVNAGKLGQIFNIDASNYSNGVTKAEKVKLLKDAKSIVDTEAAKNAPYQHLYTSKTGTEVAAHPLSFDNADFQENVKAARDLANSKLPIKTIQILPNLEAHPELRSDLLPDVKGIKNADFRIDNVVCDMKTPSENTASKNTIKNSISYAHEQGEGIVLVIEKENFISEQQLYSDIANKFRNEAYNHFKVYLKYNNEWQMWNKETWTEFYKAIKKP